MIEVIATLLRWSQLASNMILVGSCVFLAIAGSFNTPWVDRMVRLLPWLAGVLLLGLMGILVTTTAQATGVDENAWRPESWLGLVQNTRMGHIWAGRMVCALIVFGIVLYVRYAPGARWRYVMCATAAALTLAVGSLASHSAADEFSVIAILPYTLHIILASVWFGALPAFLLVVLTATRQPAQIEAAYPGNPSGSLQRTHAQFQPEETLQSGVLALKRFSLMAMPVMLAIIATGVIITDRMVDTSYAALVSTQYGWLLNAKLALLALVLMIAARARSTWLPLFAQGQELAAAGAQSLRKWVRIEFVLALVIVLLATIVANTVPAKHALIQSWPYSFRFSIDATWDDPSVVIRAWSGLALLVLAGGAIVSGRLRHWSKMRRIGIPAILVIAAMVTALPPLAIEAYPETYRKTPVPFDTISIANGAALFAEDCVACHGPQGKGNGILAKTFAKPPVDMLTEPHTAKHTAGDFFHWLTYGIPGTGMPLFADKLAEEDRWDVVNYLHAMSRGYQARLMSPQVKPNQPQPSMGPPNFSYFAHDGSSGTLKDFREQKTVLLVLFSWPQSQARLEQLRQAHESLSGSNTQILAVPMNDPDPQEIAAIMASLPFPVVTQGATEIMRSYALFRRTLGHPDLLGEGSVPEHMEFLVDRYGYLRARWIPEADGAGWTDLDSLQQQLAQLNREKEILPPPGDHVH
ncbi:MAG: CopD family protein [Nitrosomonadaceae bacterium]|nr:CopD family protein [Nitrosomonadaceae bacterium]